MSAEFQKMKQESQFGFGKVLKEIERYNAYSNRDWGNLRYGGKVKSAITGEDQFSHMAKCRGGINSCGSIFCPKCQKVKVAGIHREMLDYYEDQFSSNEKLARQKVRYGTVLHELVPVNYDNLFNEDGVIQHLITSVARLKENLKIVDQLLRRNKPSKEIYLIGTIHLEMLDVDMFRIEKKGDESDKQRTFRKWFDKVGRNSDFYFLVHTHFMIDTKGLDKDDLDKAFRSIPEWNITNEQVWIQKFSHKYRGKYQSLATAFAKISNYAYSGSNKRLRFKDAWGDSGEEVKKIEKRDARYRLLVYAEKTGRPNVGEDLTMGQIRLLIRAHNTFTDGGVDQLRVGIGC